MAMTMSTRLMPGTVPGGHNGGVFLAGEWIWANLGLGGAFVVALLGVTGLGFWVVRSEGKNRRLMEVDEQSEPAESLADGHPR